MSAVDDSLFAPIYRGVTSDWRERVREVIDLMIQHPCAMPTYYQKDRIRPAGSLLLMHMMERFHLHGQKTFYIVLRKQHRKQFEFDGILLNSTAAGVILLNGYDWSVRDLNLFPNHYNHAFVFATLAEATAYHDSL